LVIELDKQGKTKKKLLSITKAVPALSPSPNAKEDVADPEGPSIGEEDVSPEQLYLRQIEYTEEPDGTFTVNPPCDSPTTEPELKLQADFERWERELDGFSLAHPKALPSKANRPISLIIMQSDRGPRLKTMVAQSTPAVDYDCGPTTEFRLR
jgi:hypothetical protein